MQSQTQPARLRLFARMRHSGALPTAVLENENTVYIPHPNPASVLPWYPLTPKPNP